MPDIILSVLCVLRHLIFTIVLQDPFIIPNIKDKETKANGLYTLPKVPHLEIASASFQTQTVFC